MPKSVQDKAGIGFSTVAPTGWEYDTQANLTNPPWKSPITIISLGATDLRVYSIGPIMGCSVWNRSGGGPTSRINTFSTSALITPVCHHRGESEWWGSWCGGMLKWGNGGTLKFSIPAKGFKTPCASQPLFLSCLLAWSLQLEEVYNVVPHWKFLNHLFFLSVSIWYCFGQLSKSIRPFLAVHVLRRRW